MSVLFAYSPFREFIWGFSGTRLCFGETLEFKRKILLRTCCVLRFVILDKIMPNVIDNDPLVSDIMGAVRDMPGETADKLHALIRASEIVKLYFERGQLSILNATFSPSQQGPQSTSVESPK